MKQKNLTKLIIGIVVIGGGIAFLVYNAMHSSWSYYYSVDEFAAASEAVKSSPLRLAGKVKAASVEKDMEHMRLSFILEGVKNQVPVSYAGVVPDNFIEGIEVVVEGRLEPSGDFNAKMLMTRCDSKYKARMN